MSLNLTDSSVLTTLATKISRTKYFPFEVYAINLLPSSNYDVYYNGTLVNAFCKGYGIDLGSQLVSDKYGKILFMYLMAIPYNQTYLINNAPNVAGTISKPTATLELQAPNGLKSIVYIPFNLKM